jgi:hypothetical protein
LGIGEGVTGISAVREVRKTKEYALWMIFWVKLRERFLNNG